MKIKISEAFELLEATEGVKKGAALTSISVEYEKNHDGGFDLKWKVYATHTTGKTAAGYGMSFDEAVADWKKCITDRLSREGSNLIEE